MTSPQDFSLSTFHKSATDFTGLGLRTTGFSGRLPTINILVDSKMIWGQKVKVILSYATNRGSLKLSISSSNKIRILLKSTSGIHVYIHTWCVSDEGYGSVGQSVSAKSSKSGGHQSVSLPSSREAHKKRMASEGDILSGSDPSGAESITERGSGFGLSDSQSNRKG